VRFCFFFKALLFVTRYLFDSAAHFQTCGRESFRSINGHERVTTHEDNWALVGKGGGDSIRAGVGNMGCWSSKVHYIKLLAANSLREDDIDA
jgi:hypothetical protein